MIKNDSVTIYHKLFNKNTKLEEWQRFNYDNIWFFGGKGAGIDKGYDNANDVTVRIPYDNNEADINNFAIGDIIVKGHIELEITRQQDLPNNYKIYNVTSIKDNNFGNTPHIHIGGK